MCLKLPLIALCLVFGACASSLEKRVEILQEPADDIEFYFESVYELNW